MKNRKRTSWVVLLLLPLLVVGSLIGLSRSNEEQVTAAIVNLDEGTEIDGQQVPMGRQLGAEILERDGDNIHWVLADEENGRDRLISGEYAAVVTIPKDFSKKVMSFSTNDADVAEKAQVQVSVSRNSPAWDVELAQEIARIATQSLNKMLTSQYLEGIYVGFNELGGQFQTIVDGANGLKDGASQLLDAVGEAFSGTGDLSDGMDELAASGGRLSSSGEELALGSAKLADSVGKLDDGAHQLDDGVQQMKQQVPQLTDGIQQLVNAANQLLPGVQQYTDGVGTLVGGVGQLENGLRQVVEGLDQQGDFAQLQQLADGANQLADRSDQLADGIEQAVAQFEHLDGLVTDELVDQARQFQEQVSKLGEAVQRADEEMQAYVNGTKPLPEEIEAVAEEIKARFECPVADEAVCAELRESLKEGVDEALDGGFREGIRRGSQWLHSTEPNSGKTYLELVSVAGNQLQQVMGQVVEGMSQAQQILPGLTQLREGSRQLADGNAQLADGMEQLATQLPRQMSELREGLGKLHDGVGEIVEQSQPLVSSGQELGDGAVRLNEGIQQLALQTGVLQSGVGEFADGVSQLASGVSQLEGGVGQLNSGVLQYVDGVWQYTNGLTQAAEGTHELADGMAKLDEGAAKLDEGVGTFANELAKGKDQLPNYSKSDRDILADVVSSPIVSDDSLMTRGGIPLSALILAAALWVAGLAAFTIVRPVPQGIVLSSESTAKIWVRTVGSPTLIVAVVGVILGIFGGLWWGMSAGRTAGLAAILAGLGVVFTWTHHALSAWLGHVGRGLSLVLLAVTIVLGLSSGVPQWLSILGAVSPLQSGMQVTRSWLAGAPVITAIASMVFVAVLAALLSWASIRLRRQLTPATFRLRRV